MNSVRVVPVEHTRTMTTHSSTHRSASLLGLIVGSIGVVYGDIGTSPLYAFRESLAAAAGHGGVPETDMVLGVLSLIVWTLFIIVTLKYVVLLFRADNNGEGGILSLMALAQRAVGDGRGKGVILLLGMAGAAMFYGDAIITPAISVLSAVEGLKLITSRFDPYINPIALTIIVLLFVVQRRGTEKVAKFFGPITVIWFLALAAGGLLHIADAPQVFLALNPYYSIHFLTHHGYASLIALGAVFLAVTGAEALYADLGHFGKRPIRMAWLWFVMPSLLLNYFGQGALVLSHPETSANSFYLLYPEWALAPMVGLATLATIIASQAVITGAYSLTHQAIQLGILPRLTVRYTSEGNVGQIYMPQVNWGLMVGVILLMEIFRSSSSLAAAYGIAVTGTMLITATLTFIVMRRLWNWSLPFALLVITPLFFIDLSFLIANLTKVFHGGFVPILLAAAIVLMMRIWVRGCRVLYEQTNDPQHTITELISELKHHPPQRVEGTAIYLSSNTTHAPSALLLNLKHNKVLHDTNLLLTLCFERTPYVWDKERVRLQAIDRNFTRVFLHYGYMETPNVTRALSLLREKGVRLDMMSTSFFISRRSIVPSAQFGMPIWQDKIFIAMASNATDAAAYFHIPQNRVVELGAQMTV